MLTESGSTASQKLQGSTRPALTISPADTGLKSLGPWVPDDNPFVIPRVVGVDPNNPQHLIAADVGIKKMVVSTDGGASCYRMIN